MAIIYTYPQTQALQNNDLFIISQMDPEPGSTIRQTRSISAANLANYIIPLIPVGPGGGPFLPLTAGSTVPLTGDLYMAPTGAGPSVGSNAVVFRGVDDTGAELTSAEIFTLDSTINPSGQDLYFNNADDNGVLQTGLFIDAFQQVAIAKAAANAQLDVGGDGNFDTSLTVGTNVTFSNYGSGTNTGVATYSLAVTAAGQVIEEPLTSGTVTGTGTTDYFVKFTDGPNGVIGDVPGVLEQAGEVIFQQDVRFDDVVLFDGGTVSSFQDVEMLDGAAIKFVDPAGPTLDAQLSSAAGSGKLNIEGSLQFDNYGSGTITGTAAYNLSVDASGNVIETATGGGGGVGGSGTIDNIPIWTGATTLGDSRIRRVPSGTAASTDAEIVMSNNVIVRNPPNINTSGPYLYVSGGANIFENVLLGLRDEGNLSNNINRIEFYSGPGTGTDFDRSGRFASIYAINDGASAANGGTLSIETQSTPGTGGTVNTGQIKLLNTGQNQFSQYGSGTFTGTASYNLSVDASGNIIETATGGGGSGYKSLQVFQWTAGNPTAYQNYPIGAPAAFLPFDPTPQIETGTYSGAAGTFAWTCVNVAAAQPPSPTPVEAEFTLGASGAGTWEVKTCQHWFDQNQFLEVNIAFTINGTVVDVIDQRVNDGAGDRIYNGYLFREFSAGDVLKVRVIFANGSGAAPFPSDANNRPIEISFNKIV